MESLDVEGVIIADGSSLWSCSRSYRLLSGKRRKVGLISVHLYRPFSAKYFFDVLPKLLKRFQFR